MAETAYVLRQVQLGAKTYGQQATITGNATETYDASGTTALTAGQNPTVPFEFVGNDCKVFMAVASVDMTINPDAGPTIALLAGVPYMWSDDSGLTNPFAGVSVTEFVVTNVEAGDLQIVALSDV